MKALLIDHDDSFTFNLRHWLFAVAANVDIISHREITNQIFSDYDFVVLSPGPKSPHNYPHITNWLKHHYFIKPIFGVCLGMQLMTIASNGQVRPSTNPKHGKKSVLHIQYKLNCNYERDLDSLSSSQVARYHSLICSELNDFKILAFSDENDSAPALVPMWIEHLSFRWMGVQFHPESFMTEKSELIQAFLKKWIMQ